GRETALENLLGAAPIIELYRPVTNRLKLFRKEILSMNRLDVIRAWKDEDYRMGLSEAERNLLPDNPAGSIEIMLDAAQGGAALAMAGISFPGICTCIGICPPSQDIACGVTVGLCSFLDACPEERLPII
ncbi:MAG TPA: mersacidin/lichenicidin family type 2 lantibiotic, partial [Blastocatellia bacterium]|nr:mersacidin/lichenicidin family type 2 lantibiotic [Blastocatellia bacterium]